MMYENQTKWKILRHKVFERRIREAFELFRQNDIEPVLIKGWAAALNYPNVYEREYVDIDLAVSEDDYAKALKVVSENSVSVDLHRELRHLDTLDWKKLFDRARLITQDDYPGCPIRILSSEDHLRVLCVHWLNDGGACKEKLWDIYYAVARRPADFEWEKCLEVVSCKRKRWIICAIALAEKYLELDVSGTPAADGGKRIPGWVIQTVEKEWNSGVRLKPLEYSMKNAAEFYEQLKIRIPPNPIQATIEMDGEFDEKSRMLIQAGNLFLRAGNILKQVGGKKANVKK